MIPTIHLNGTAAGDLIGQLEAASRALVVAIDRLCEAGPNGRDYYPQGPDAFSTARREHSARVLKLHAINADLLTIWETLVDGGAGDTGKDTRADIRRDRD
jgi:hypothetical protein